jgi:hypothetical protein
MSPCILPGLSFRERWERKRWSCWYCSVAVRESREDDESVFWFDVEWDWRSRVEGGYASYFLSLPDYSSRKSSKSRTKVSHQGHDPKNVPKSFFIASIAASSSAVVSKKSCFIRVDSEPAAQSPKIVMTHSNVPHPSLSCFSHDRCVSFIQSISLVAPRLVVPRQCKFWGACFIFFESIDWLIRRFRHRSLLGDASYSE